MRFGFFVGMVLVLASAGLQASPRLGLTFAPTGIGDEVGRLISRSAAHELVRLFELYPPLSASTILDDEGNTLLHALARSGQDEMIALTHFFGYDQQTISRKNDNGETPADVAGDFPSTQQLLKDMLSSKDSSGTDPLTEAARRGDLPSVQLLAKALTWRVAVNKVSGEDPKALGGLLIRPLLAAIAAFENETFSFLLDLAHKAEFDSRTFLNEIILVRDMWNAIIRDDNAYAAKLLLDTLLDTKEGNSRLTYKLRNNNNFNLRNSIDFNFGQAISNGAPNTVQVFLEADVLDNYDDDGKARLAKRLKESIEEFTKQDKPVEGHLEVLALLDKHGVSIAEAFGEKLLLQLVALKAGFQAGEPQVQAAH